MYSWLVLFAMLGLAAIIRTEENLPLILCLTFGPKLAKLFAVPIEQIGQSHLGLWLNL